MENFRHHFKDEKTNDKMRKSSKTIDKALYPNDARNGEWRMKETIVKNIILSC